MTIRPLITLATDKDRRTAAHWCMTAPADWTVQWRPRQRSDRQNRRLWAMLSDIAKQADHHGLKLDAEDWKILALDALHRDMRAVPNLDGNGLVMLGRSSSALNVAEMSDLIELLFALGAQKAIRWTDPSLVGEPEQKASAA